MPERVQGFRCITCQYPLDGLAADGVCPECATEVRRSLSPVPDRLVAGRFTVRLQWAFTILAAANTAGPVIVLTDVSGMWGNHIRGGWVFFAFVSALFANAAAWTLAASGDDRPRDRAPGRTAAAWAAWLNWAMLGLLLIAILVARGPGGSGECCGFAILGVQALKGLMGLGAACQIAGQLSRRLLEWGAAIVFVGVVAHIVTGIALFNDATSFGPNVLLILWCAVGVYQFLIASRLRQFNQGLITSLPMPPAPPPEPEPKDQA